MKIFFLWYIFFHRILITLCVGRNEHRSRTRQVIGARNSTRATTLSVLISRLTGDSTVNLRLPIFSMCATSLRWASSEHCCLIDRLGTGTKRHIPWNKTARQLLLIFVVVDIAHPWDAYNWNCLKQDFPTFEKPIKRLQNCGSKMVLVIEHFCDGYDKMALHSNRLPQVHFSIEILSTYRLVWLSGTGIQLQTFYSLPSKHILIPLVLMPPICLTTRIKRFNWLLK